MSECKWRSLLRRFWSRVNKKGPVPAHCPELGSCWVWTGAKDKDGYGKISIRNKQTRTHRVGYHLSNPGASDELAILHKCDNRACVRDTHLFQGTNADNNADMLAKGRLPTGEKHWTKKRVGPAHPLAKLNEAQRRKAKALLDAGRPRKEVAEMFGVSRPTLVNSVRIPFSNVGM